VGGRHSPPRRGSADLADEPGSALIWRRRPAGRELNSQPFGAPGSSSPPEDPQRDDETHRPIDKFDIFDVIAGEKDVDGLSCHCVSGLYRARQQDLLFLPCTALAVRRLIAFYKIPTHGKTAVVVGRNDITSKPVHLMMGGRMCNATSVWVHRHTPKDVHDRLMRDADIIVTAVGNVNYRITRDLVKPGATVIDVGTRVGTDGKLHGDADLPSVREVAGFVTPVPGGVGPVTVAALTENLLRAAQFAVGAGKRGYEF
jgi:methylenetetrahydrofolate dehydrogenase (NADP+)/methenyltetrahydrofolate cyclohydrolase